MMQGVQYFPSMSRRDPNTSWDQHRISIPGRPQVGAAISIEDLDTSRNMRSRRYWCWRGWIGGRCWGRYGRRETEIHPLSIYTKGQRASLHVDFHPSCSKERSPQNDRHIGALIHIHNKEVA